MKKTKTKTMWLQLYRLKTETGIQFEINDFHIWGGWYRLRIDAVWYELPEIEGEFRFGKHIYSDLSVQPDRYATWAVIPKAEVLKTLKEF